MKKNSFLKTFMISLWYFSLPLVAFTAVDGEPKNIVKIKNPLGTTSTLPDLLQKILTTAIKLGMPLLALAIIYSGFLFVAARGNSEKISKAKDTLLYTIIGAAILLGSWTIANMINATVDSLK